MSVAPPEHPARPLRLVVVVDDDDDMREVITMALSSRPGLTVVSSVGTGEEGLEAVVAHGPDVVVLDLAMPGQGGEWAAEQIRQARPDTRIVIHSAQITRSVERRLRDLGVAGVVRKGAPLDELYDAIESATAGA